MGKGKLQKFAEMDSFANVFQVPSQTPSDKELPLPAGFVEPGRWAADYFHNNNPIVLELGCGRGEYTVGLATLFPEKNFIGIDIKGARMWHGAKQALQAHLSNVAFLRTQIEFIERFFVPGEIAEIWLTFSDPQMKKVSKRLTSTYFLNRYRHILIDGGLIHLKTDSNFLFTYTEQLVALNDFLVEVSTRNLYKDCAGDIILSIRTYYEQQWLDRGIDIKYLQFHLPQAGSLQEPEVEIELDEYRSYHRDKRSSKLTSK